MYIWWLNTKLQSLFEHSAKNCMSGKAFFFICNEFWHMKGTPFWMIHLVYGHFLQLSTSEWLQIAYFDSTKCFTTFSNVNSHEGSFKNHKYPFLNDPKSQKGGFWPFSGVKSVDQVLKFNKIIELSSSTGLTGSRGLKGLTGLTGTNVEPMAPRPCYSSQR